MINKNLERLYVMSVNEISDYTRFFKRKVKLQGPCLTISNHGEIPGLNCIGLILKIRVVTSDPETKDIRLDKYDEDQHQWFHLLNFIAHGDRCFRQGEPSDYYRIKDLFNLSEWKPKPYFGFKALAKMYVRLYYEDMKCPAKGSKFKAINKYGEINEYEITCDKILCDGYYFDDVNNWYKHHLFIIPQEDNLIKEMYL